MIKSKAKKRYYGTKAYADGYLGKVVSHTVTEDADGMSEEFTFNNGMKFNKIVSIEKVAFVTKMDVVTAIVRVDGRTYVGNAVKNPTDSLEVEGGRELALARALKDTKTEKEVLDWINEQDYFEKRNEEVEAEPETEIETEE